MTRSDKPDLSAIELMILDVDGVLTDGAIMINADGSETKRFSLLDGHGIRMWHRAGLRTAILSGRAAPATRARAKQLEINYILEDCHEKLPAFEKLLQEVSVDAKNVAYIGDDVLDIPVLRRAGFAVAVANAVDEAKSCAHYITSQQGGGGAVREVIEYILKNTNKWDALMQRYLV